MNYRKAVHDLRLARAVMQWEYTKGWAELTRQVELRGDIVRCVKLSLRTFSEAARTGLIAGGFRANRIRPKGFKQGSVRVSQGGEPIIPKHIKKPWND